MLIDKPTIEWGDEDTTAERMRIRMYVEEKEMLIRAKMNQLAELCNRLELTQN